MNPRIKNPLTKSREFLPTYYQVLSDAFKRVRETLQVSGQDNHQNCIKAAEATNLLASMENYIACAKLADLDTSSLNGALNKLKQIVSTTGEPIAGNMSQCIQEQIIDPVWNFNYDNVLIKQGLGNTTFSIEGLPKEMLNIIASYSGAKPTIRLCLSNQPSHTLFKPNLDKLSVQELLHHIANGQLDKVITMLTVNPHLAVELRGTVTTCSGNTYKNVTGIELMYLLDDIDMCEKTLLCLPTETRIKADEQLTKKMEEVAKQASEFKPYDFSALVQAITVDQELINTGQPNSETKQALAKFKEDFKPCLIQVGKSFIKEQLKKGYKLYHQNLKNLWNSEQSDWYFINIIGTLQSKVEKCFEQVCSQGLGESVDQKPLQRSDKIRNSINDCEMTYRGSADAKLILGQNYFVEIYHGRGVNTHVWVGSRTGFGIMSEYFQQQNQAWKNLSDSFNSQHKKSFQNSQGR